MASQESRAVLSHARMLQDAARQGTTRSWLRGKNVALLCEDGDAEDQTLFHEAATGLGARVARIHHSLAGLDTPQEVRHAARLLGRLYDALECQGMAPNLVRQLSAEAGVPVYDGLASSRHPTAALATQLPGLAHARDKRRFVLQAVLLHTLT
ncbi:ornithine carbamoyltransferase [Xylophilus sp. ASV27]|uniref:ornithine carbamoyltransferase n=1 Tax=Xylophilus sp. ASV27 TaxID=2795129 RepID=UPI0018EC8911|nr:ornithine carbamoyltransferase [Xylophilus sp. ASV27]